MEKITGIKIRSIFLDKQNWWIFFNKYQSLIRDSIIVNVCKVLACGTSLLGFHKYECPQCHKTKNVFHTCKSRFCSACGKKATEQWIENNLQTLPNVPWQHITFTLPEEIRPLFWLNRSLLNTLASIPAKLITQLAKKKNLIPGIFMAIHTFGRDLKQNVHFHVSITSGGLSIDHTKWINSFYIHHQIIKDLWKAAVVSTLRRLFKKEKLELPKSLKDYTNSYTAFNSWLNFLYNKSWVVHLQKPCADHVRNIKYLGRYLKRPPIAETRITQYDGQTVTYRFLDHHEKTRTTMNLPVEEFIGRLIRHIPDTNFRLIRYYNWLSNQKRGKLLPIVYALLKQVAKTIKKVFWRDLFRQSFGIDPLICKVCNIAMELVNWNNTKINDITTCHKILAAPIG